MFRVVEIPWVINVMLVVGVSVTAN